MASFEPRKGTVRFFAVASLGKNRWYWVVWPSLAELQAAREPLLHVGEGHETTKAAAVEHALALAGGDAEWIAAKYARLYHRGRSGIGRRPRHAAGAGVPDAQQFLYRDIYDPAQDSFTSVPHRVVKKTSKSVYVERRPYAPDAPTGTWLDGARRTFRLDRQKLEREGYAFIPIAEHVSDDSEPIFFTMPRDERLEPGKQTPECLAALGLAWPCTAADVRRAYRRLAKQSHPDGGGTHDRFLALQEAYNQALWICR